MDSARQTRQQTTQREGGQGTTGDGQVEDNVRQASQGNLAADDTTREWEWRTCNNAKGGGNDDDDNDKNQSLWWQ